VQRHAIPLILQGDDVLICAPTAAGKTEAVCAPLLERNYYSTMPWKVLYISPTRALINDLYYRLITPVEHLGLKISRYTGDHHQRLDDAALILTTPESFDSLMCRGRRKGGHILADVCALVLDEIHFLLGSARGEHVRWLIERLMLLKRHAKKEKWIKNDSIQRVALSATVPAPDKVAKDYLDAERGRVVFVPGGRRIDVVCDEEAAPLTEDCLLSYLKMPGKSEKILVFCNARKRVDTLLDAMKENIEKAGFVALAHHGSLSKTVREEAEYAMKTEKKVVMFATSTLEIGVDIGDIDLIVLDGPAPDMPSLLQRIGRGNRRTNTTRVMPCFGSMAECVIQSAMIEAARGNKLFPDAYGPCHSVARQQVASYIFQSPKRSRNCGKIRYLLGKCADPIVADSLIDHMIEEGELFLDGDGVRLNEEWRNRSERGDIHSNIESTPGVILIDEDSDKVLATGLRPSDGKVLKLAGKLMEIRKWENNKVFVGQLKKNVKPDTVWGYHSRSWIKGAGQPQSVKHYLGVEDTVWPLLHLDGESVVFHFGGGRRKAVLEIALRDNKDVPTDVKITEWYLAIRGRITDKPPWLMATGPSMLMLKIGHMLDQLEKTLSRPYANKKLPAHARIHEVTGWLNLVAELELIKDAKWEHVNDSNTAFALESIKKYIG